MLLRTNFKRDELRNFFIDYDALKDQKESLDDFVSNEPLIDKDKFRKKDFPQEIKFNNAIEGIDDDVKDIDRLLKRMFVSVNQDKKRITNLYTGYEFILKNKEINKDSLKKLYNILSDGLLKESDKNRMGEYYRKGTVYIMRGTSLDRYFKGVDPKNIDEYMNILFDYINNGSEESNIDNFIKSQIIHCYLVYIHPYFDVNGRTSRTLGMWYLLNNKNISYMTFNRSISFMKGNYDKSLVMLRERGDMTPFLKYILDAERIELEKEYIINNIEKNIGKKFNNNEYLILEYFLSINGNLTLLDLISMYNNYNSKKKKSIILQDEINPLIDKNIIIKTEETSHNITPNIKNSRIILNRDVLDIDEGKIKKLKLNHYINNVQD